ncbi:hypothetical protein NC652_006718 [Populus alba x Populus x berolinensis]|nr:hypothetical protein NC652_006715 [Populus alba x Populus x berolinensis]KAJ6955375.1 hypothetical protein NC652_006718 [Populus alba x Populus x berolinensis]
MAKKSQRHPVRYEREQSGCMWGLITMFDFRHGRSTQKLISDRRRGTRHAVGTGTPKNKVDNLSENCLGMIDGEESRKVTDDTSKVSVKKLIEEEMFGEQDIKKEINNPGVEPKQSNSENGDHRRRKSRTKSCDIHIEDLNVSESLESERPCLHNLEKQSTGSLDIGEIMEDFCRQIHQKRFGNAEHDQLDEVHHQLNQKNPEFEEKLSEAIKLINEKLVNWKHVAEDGNFHPSKELRDALQILISDEELFPKLLQGPKSIMVKHVQSLWNAQVEKGEESKSLPGSNSSEQGLHGFRHSDEAIHGKQHKFFRRKTKSLEKNPSKENKACQASNRIVILKPGPTSMLPPKNESIIGSLPKSQFTIGDKVPNERFGSNFFLTEIKRKLKNAMGKERQDTSTDGTSKKFATKQQAVGNSEKGSKENLGRSSPSKDHFFIEKIARPPMFSKMREKTGKLKEHEISMECEAAIYPKHRESNIYIEAKKHLSEMLSTGQADAGFSGEQVPKTLGRILSLPEYSFSPIDSPGKDWEQGFLTAQMRFSADDKFQKHETNVSHLGRIALNSEPQSSVSNDSTDCKGQASSNPNASASNELHDKEDKTLCSVGDEMPSEGEAEVVKETETAIDEEGDVLDTLFEPSKSPVDGDGQNGDMSEVCDKKENSECLEHHSEEQTRTSPLTSPSTSSNTKKLDCLEGPSEIPERPSPISVLEPLFKTEEDVSPASSRFEPVELPVQPLRIQFEEHESSSADRIPLKASIDDKESVFEYVKAVVQASGMKWDEFYMRSHSSEQLLDQSIFFEVEFFSNQLCCDKKLLFDSINEVLMEVYGRYFGCFSGLSFVQSNIRPVPDVKSGICEVWEGVSWHLLPLPMPHTLDQLVKKDMAKTGTWMNLPYDIETILVEIGEDIFEDLMEEIVFGDLMEENLFIHVNKSLGGGNQSISVESKETESSMSS